MPLCAPGAPPETAMSQISRAVPPQPPAQARQGRLIFAMDATLSRQPTWDMAQGLQARMFEAAGRLGGLAVQLVYFRGHDECRASRFVADGRGLATLMSKIAVAGGFTQIGKVLRHARKEAAEARIGALVFVGDAMEENIDELCGAAGELALLGVKAFMFHEGSDAKAARAFREIARITGGAYAAFDASAADRLAALLGAAAAYAAGGRGGLEAFATASGADVSRLLSQIK